MSQHDYVIDNGSGAAVRTDINNALQALASLNAGASEPATTYAYMFWADTVNSLLKMRNGSNTGWVSLGNFTLANLGHLTGYFPAGTKMVFYQAAPPPGWTKDTSHNDKALRVVSGSGGGSGGTHALSSPPAHTHDLGNHTHTAPETGSHVLTKAELPPHVHTTIAYNKASIWDTGHINGYKWHSNSDLTTTGDGSADGLAGAGHTHPSGGATSTPSKNTSGAASATFSPQYIDVIVAIKD